METQQQKLKSIVTFPLSSNDSTLKKGKISKITVAINQICLFKPMQKPFTD